MVEMFERVFFIGIYREPFFVRYISENVPIFKITEP